MHRLQLQLQLIHGRLNIHDVVYDVVKEQVGGG
jgi:hypothetical protein